MSAEIRELSICIERLCDSIRNLRRENPEAFFDRPIEKFYKSMEAALEDFYRAKMEEDK